MNDTIDQTKTDDAEPAVRSPDEMRISIARLEKKIKKLEGDVKHLRSYAAELAKECAVADGSFPNWSKF